MRRARTCARCRSRARRCCARSAKPSRGRRRRLRLVRPESVEDAAAALGNGTVGLAGGTEVVPQLRSGLLRADTLVELKTVVPRGIDGARIGAGTTLAELEVDPQIPQALREACAASAS